MAVGNENFSIGLSIAAVFGVMLAHLSVNLFDDYFDYQFHSEDVRQQTAEEGQRARIAKSPYLSFGVAIRRQLFLVALVFVFAAILFCFVVFLEC